MIKASFKGAEMSDLNFLGWIGMVLSWLWEYQL